MAQDGGLPATGTAVPALSVGAIVAITQDWRSAKGTHPDPVLQCLLVRPVAYTGGEDSYRGVMSDGEHWCLCLFARPLNDMIKEGRIVKGSICRIARYSHFTFNNEKEALIILDIEVLQESEIREKIGDPRAAPPSPRLRTASSAFDPPMWHADRSVYPVDAISPFAREWTIKVRVTSKSGMSGQGDCSEGGGQRGFRVALADGTGAIEAAGWEGYDAFYKLLEVGFWYYISSPCGFSYGLDNFELRLEAGTIVERVED